MHSVIFSEVRGVCHPTVATSSVSSLYTPVSLTIPNRGLLPPIRAYLIETLTAPCPNPLLNRHTGWGGFLFYCLPVSSSTDDLPLASSSTKTTHTRLWRRVSYLVGGLLGDFGGDATTSGCIDVCSTSSSTPMADSFPSDNSTGEKGYGKKGFQRYFRVKEEQNQASIGQIDDL